MLKTFSGRSPSAIASSINVWLEAGILGTIDMIGSCLAVALFLTTTFGAVTKVLPDFLCFFFNNFWNWCYYKTKSCKRVSSMKCWMNRFWVKVLGDIVWELLIQCKTNNSMSAVSSLKSLNIISEYTKMEKVSTPYFRIFVKCPVKCIVLWEPEIYLAEIQHPFSLKRP